MRQAFGKSEKGLHLKNQDAFFINREKGLFAVADGVTLSKNSEKASRTAIDALKGFDGNIERFFFGVNEKVRKLKDGTTTLTVASIKNNILEVGHVGDSSLFLMRNKIKKITEDDSIEGSNILTQAMGMERIKPHFYRMRIKKGDVLLLATDGVAKYIGEKEVLHVLEERLERVPQQLIQIAKKKPKLYEDDKTVVVVKIV